MFCTQCGKKNVESANFCGFCGSAIRKGDQVNVEPSRNTTPQPETPTEHQVIYRSNHSLLGCIYCGDKWNSFFQGEVDLRQLSPLHLGFVRDESPLGLVESAINLFKNDQRLLEGLHSVHAYDYVAAQSFLKEDLRLCKAIKQLDRSVIGKLNNMFAPSLPDDSKSVTARWFEMSGLPVASFHSLLTKESPSWMFVISEKGLSFFQMYPTIEEEDDAHAWGRAFAGAGIQSGLNFAGSVTLGAISEGAASLGWKGSDAWGARHESKISERFERYCERIATYSPVFIARTMTGIMDQPKGYFVPFEKINWMAYSKEAYDSADSRQLYFTHCDTLGLGLTFSKSDIDYMRSIFSAAAPPVAKASTTQDLDTE